MSNPVDAFLEKVAVIKPVKKLTGISALRDTQKKEMEMWAKWKANGEKPSDLRPLLASFKPLIASRSNVWATRLRDIPPGAVRAEFTAQAVQAFQTYDPNRGAKLSTHLGHQLKKAQRFCTTYQNPGRIPENRIYKIRELQDATTRLDEDLGRMPSQLEIADKLKWSPRQVDVLQREIRRALPTGQFESDPSSFTPSRHKEIMRLLPYELSGEERQVFEHLYGVGGRTKLGPGQIAKKLGISAPKVSRLKKAIADKYSKYAE